MTFITEKKLQKEHFFSKKTIYFQRLMRSFLTPRMGMRMRIPPLKN